MAIKGNERLVVLISTIVENLLPDENFESYRSFLQAKSYKNGTIMYEAKVLLDKKLRMKKIEFVEVGVWILIFNHELDQIKTNSVSRKTIIDKHKYWKLKEN